MLERVDFNDDRGCSRFNLYYAPILFSKKKDSGMFLLFFKGPDEIHKMNIRFCNNAPNGNTGSMLLKI